ncbi:hypothetical protein PYH37_000896 [Sinorhizobium numidicum]|uniref:Transmembrane protein n=1 Tax=Sinorhizobium numidicum TaxID=680248 RepID=A0ABY8CVW5_9HYPH|nr:hypothetical protein [Sinorhizobium numidicum]WEX75478.1 hypothetical protein PYH37_000896 [Sinorhizobium numidicum]WEX81475.1 hypothetical protein PYH38_000897 [Sinorhizobium numidicum]
MHFLTRRLEAFNRDELPDWPRSPKALWRVFLIASSLVEFFLFYMLSLLVLAAVIVLMIVAWLIRVDRKPAKVYHR